MQGFPIAPDYKVDSMGSWYERLKSRRLDLGYSQADIYRRVGVKNSTVSDWEAGKFKPRGENLNRLCHVLQVNADWLLYGKEPMSPLPDTVPAVTGGNLDLTATEFQLLLDYRKGGEAKKAAIALLASLPEPEMAALLLVLQSISSKYKKSPG